MVAFVVRHSQQKKGLRIHQANSGNMHAHNVRRVYFNQIVKGRICPFCESTFESHESAVQHAQHAHKRGWCRVNRAFMQKAWEEPEVIECPMCEASFDELTDYHIHLEFHISFPQIVSLLKSRVNTPF